jgi:hypothetical protein
VAPERDGHVVSRDGAGHEDREAVDPTDPRTAGRDAPYIQLDTLGHA